MIEAMTEAEDPTAIALPPRTPRQKLSAAAILASLALVGIAQRDLRRRPSEEIRGSRLVWRIASTNAIGAVLYLWAGRRSAAS
jgi:hypothetical protein